jgi:hypothetical protein
VHPSRPVVIVGGAFALLALVLPFVTLPVIGSIDGFGGEAWPAVAALAPAVLLAAVGDWSHGSAPVPGGVALACACGGLVFAVTKLADAIVAARDAAGGALGPGAGVLVGGCAVAAAGAALALRRA